MHSSRNTQNKVNDSRVWCCKHLVIEELISVMGCRVQTNALQYAHKERFIQQAMTKLNTLSLPDHHSDLRPYLDVDDLLT